MTAKGHSYISEQSSLDQEMAAWQKIRYGGDWPLYAGRDVRVCLAVLVTSDVSHLRP